MSQKLISVMVNEELYEMVQKHCFNKGKKIKEFFAEALHTELVLQNGDTYAKKPSKR